MCSKLGGSPKTRREKDRYKIVCELPEPKTVSIDAGYDALHDETFLTVFDGREYITKLLGKAEIRLLGYGTHDSNLYVGTKEEGVHEEFDRYMRILARGWIMTHDAKHIEVDIIPPKRGERPIIWLLVSKYKLEGQKR